MNFLKSSIKPNESKSACTTCTNRCCDRMPGIVFPEQLKEITLASITELLTNGYCLDWWEGDPRMGGTLGRVLYIRPRIVGFEDKVFHGSWGGRCIFLTATGCKHKFQDRPLECQDLIPNSKSPGNCKSGNNGHYNKRNASLAWIPYQDILQEAGDAVRSKPKAHEH